MLKSITIILLALTGITYCNANENTPEKAKNLIKNADFSNGFKYWYAHAFPVEKKDDTNVLVIKGKPELGKKNSYLKCASNLSWLLPSNVANKKFTFSVTAKAVKVSGKVTFAIREITEDKKSIYRSIVIRKRDCFDWKRLTKTFTASSKTVKLAVYIVARYLKADDRIMAQNICLEYVE